MTLEEFCGTIRRMESQGQDGISLFNDVISQGYRLKIYDAYRPTRAVARFLRWIADASDTRMKARFYPGIDKSELVARGFIAKRSGHSRGSSVDLTLYDQNTGAEADMGGIFDRFGDESRSDWCGDPDSGKYNGGFPGDAPASDGKINEAQFRNRMRLRVAMMRHGFIPLAEEWWHFTLADEPYPDTYFDFPIK